MDMPQCGGSGQHIDISLFGFQTQAEIAVILLPVQEIQIVEYALCVTDGPVQIFIEKTVHVITHTQMKQTFMFDGQFYGLAQILEGQIIAILYFALYFIHTDAALIAAVVPQVT